MDVNRFARTTSWGHGFLAGYYERVLSPVGAGILVLALLLIAGWWSARSHPEHMPAIIWSALGALAMYGINQVVAKSLVQARPYNAIRGVEVLVPRASSIGSPSGHAVVAGAVFCGLLLARCWRLAVVALLAGSLLLFSEVYVGAAYPSQVGVGAAAGLLVVLVLWPLAVAAPAARRSGNRLEPVRHHGGLERVAEKAAEEARQAACGPGPHAAYARREGHGRLAGGLRSGTQRHDGTRRRQGPLRGTSGRGPSRAARVSPYGETSEISEISETAVASSAADPAQGPPGRQGHDDDAHDDADRRERVGH